ncbi:hypothetical protein INR49_016289 [Caranx melampygus]|nr:hypothetical protein INR49_016289 [Caranx melampygus]
MAAAKNRNSPIWDQNSIPVSGARTAVPRVLRVKVGRSSVPHDAESLSSPLSPSIGLLSENLPGPTDNASNINSD